MDVHKLNRFFNPKRIAVIGVTANPNSVGGKLLANLVGGGFDGVVYPVNAEREAVLGIQCYPQVTSLPKTPDLGVICAPSVQVPDLVRQCGEAGILGLIIISAGFKESGPDGKLLEEQVKLEAARFPGMRIMGPNCLGLISPGKKLNISFAGGMPRAGHVAFISQSGALCTSVLDWALDGKIGFSHFVSIGNTIDVDFGDLIDYFGEDENTESIILYIESISEARKFMTAARAFARTKPIIAYKAGRFPESAQAAASHTGAMASEDAVYDAAFQRIGVARVFDIGDIFDCTELIGRRKIPGGPRLAIITNAGGPGVMATDALIEANGLLAKLSDKTIDDLNETLPPAWSHSNPVDVLGDANSKRIEKAVQIVLRDPAIDAVLVILTPQAMTNPTASAKVVGRLAETSQKPILASWVGGSTMHEGSRILAESGVPTYRTPEQAIRAFMTLVAYSRNLETLYETPKDMLVDFKIDRDKLRNSFISTNFDGQLVLSEDTSKSLIETYGIPVTRPYRAKSANEAVEMAEKIGYPVAVKINSPDITHKTDVGGVALSLENASMVRESFERILISVSHKKPNARIDGVTVQRMITKGDSTELIIGIKKDAVFGTVIMAGMGGIGAELFSDKALGFPPLNERLARRMLESLKIWPLLRGYRGRPAVDIEKLIEALIRLSYLAADYPEISELDINPLYASPRDIVALDARIVIDQSVIGKTVEPYSHLALRPYPEIYVKKATLKEGTEVILRPIKPEDEPMWMELLASCSKESIYLRFRYFFQWASHEVAARYCYIDYDREMAIVAEITESETRKLIGVGRLIADPDHESVEYAVLIADTWQQKDLGRILTEYCLEIARKWKLRKVTAVTTTDNHPMIAVFQKLGFEINFAADSTVEVSKMI